MKRDIARELYRSYRSGYKKKKEVVEQERSLNGEPEKISNLMNELVQNREWRQGIAEGNLFSDWARSFCGLATWRCYWFIGRELSSRCT